MIALPVLCLTSVLPAQTAQKKNFLPGYYEGAAAKQICPDASEVIIHHKQHNISFVAVDESKFIAPKEAVNWLKKDILKARNEDDLVELIDLLGRVILEKTTTIVSGKLHEEIELNEIMEGMYLVRVMANSRVYCAEITYQK